MRLRLDSESGVPYYQQVVQQVKQLIVSGTLAAGDRLPTVREMAAELTLNSNTVARAYQDLEREGIVETRRGLGTFACAPSATFTRQDRQARIAALLDQALLEAQHLGLTDSEINTLLQERLKENHDQLLPC